MKKRRKVIESFSIRVYEQVMRKLLLNNLSWIFVFLTVTSVANLRAETPFFLILNDGTDIVDEAAHLAQKGVRIHHQVPPQILIANFPDSVNPKTMASVKFFTTSAVSLDTLQPLGPLAVAAGTQWNRQLLADSKRVGSQATAGAIRSLVARQSLPSPQGVLCERNGHTLHVSWTGLSGALFYEVESASDETFSNRISFDQTSQPTADLPAPIQANPSTVFVRVRAVDVVTTETGSRENVYGAFSRTATVSVPASISETTSPAPLLTSPLSNFESRGFNLILEWQANASTPVRIQVARSSDFGRTIVDAISATGEFVCPSPDLRVGDKLYWRAQFWGDQKSDWSEIRTINVNAPENSKTDVFVNPEAPR